MVADVIHREVYFSGRVQGVGFRYSAMQIAREFEVSGYVENLPDGRVHLDVEGEVAEVSAYVDELKSKMEQYIRQVQEHTSRRQRQHSGFIIKH
ncbi:MAG: acylphosphatase [Verrucomicrobiota bacterium]|nr:acylphosphatase [Verrucomicrobiota bacterium]